MLKNSNDCPSSALALRDFSFIIPESLVAQHPLDERDGARLFVLTPDGSFQHSRVSDLDQWIPPKSLLVVNSSKVLPARFFAHTPTGARIEVMLVRMISSGVQEVLWSALGRPLKKLKEGLELTLSDNLTAVVQTISPQLDEETPTFTIRFPLSNGELTKWLDRNGYVPLPPYIRRAAPVPAHASDDSARYQTVYAKETGSVAAPTAGLHLSELVLQKLLNKGVEVADVTLHVGGGTFLPVKSNDISKHKMHHENYQVSSATLMKILEAQASGRPIVAVGTTTLRCLESFYLAGDKNPENLHRLAGSWLSTDLFVRPRTRTERYRPWAVTSLMTNFHQSESTLFMLISALIGLDVARSLYEEAVKQEYRFFSYGDACLLSLV